jgi:hypothetical protein
LASAPSQFTFNPQKKEPVKTTESKIPTEAILKEQKKTTHSLPLVNLQAAQKKAVASKIPLAERSSPVHQKPRAQSEGNLNTSQGHMAWENSRVNETSQAAVYGNDPSKLFELAADRRQKERRLALRKSAQLVRKKKNSNNELFLMFGAVVLMCFFLVFGAYKYKQKQDRKTQAQILAVQIAEKAKLQKIREQKEEMQRRKDERIEREINQRKDAEEKQKREQIERLENLEKIKKQKLKEKITIRENANPKNKPQKRIVPKQTKSAQTQASQSSVRASNQSALFKGIRLSSFPVAGCSPCVTSAQFSDGTPVNIITPSFIPWFQARRMNKKVVQIRGVLMKKSDGSNALNASQIFP